MAESWTHPNSGDLYTPFTADVLALFERMRAEHGSWRSVAAVSGKRMKVIRNLRNGDRKAISQTLLDSLCTTTGVGSVDEFTWFTADDLVALGIWEPVQSVTSFPKVKRTAKEAVEHRTNLKRARKARKRLAQKKAQQEWEDRMTRLGRGRRKGRWA